MIKALRTAPCENRQELERGAADLRQISNVQVNCGARRVDSGKPLSSTAPNIHFFGSMTNKAAGGMLLSRRCVKDERRRATLVFSGLVFFEERAEAKWEWHSANL